MSTRPPGAASGSTIAVLVSGEGFSVESGAGLLRMTAQTDIERPTAKAQAGLHLVQACRQMRAEAEAVVIGPGKRTDQAVDEKGDDLGPPPHDDAHRRERRHGPRRVGVDLEEGSAPAALNAQEPIEDTADAVGTTGLRQHAAHNRRGEGPAARRIGIARRVVPQVAAARRIPERLDGIERIPSYRLVRHDLAEQDGIEGRHVGIEERGGLGSQWRAFRDGIAGLVGAQRTLARAVGQPALDESPVLDERQGRMVKHGVGHPRTGSTPPLRRGRITDRAGQFGRLRQPPRDERLMGHVEADPEAGAGIALEELDPGLDETTRMEIARAEGELGDAPEHVPVLTDEVEVTAPGPVGPDRAEERALLIQFGVEGVVEAASVGRDPLLVHQPREHVPEHGGSELGLPGARGRHGDAARVDHPLHVVLPDRGVEAAVVRHRRTHTVPRRPVEPVQRGLARLDRRDRSIARRAAVRRDDTGTPASISFRLVHDVQESCSARRNAWRSDGLHGRVPIPQHR